jgi:hypothetical protein
MSDGDIRAIINNAGDAGNAGSSGPSKGKTDLVIDPGELVRAAEELRDVMAEAGRFYDRGQPVCITKSARDKMPIASALTKNSVVIIADKLCVPIKDGEKATLPNRVAELYLDLRGEWKLPPLRAISTAPVLSDDGSIRDGSGYDEASGLYLYDVPKLVVPPNPTQEDAARALVEIRQSFETFPFTDAAMVKGPDGIRRIDPKQKMGSDESAFLNGLLTAICRQSLPLAPGLMLNAPTHSGAGTGKGLIARSLSMTAYGCAPHPFTKGDGPQETDKRLASALIEGRPMVYLDNANQTLLKSDTLASAITEPTCQIRPLGKSQMIELEIGSFFIVTGNGLSITEDLVRRFLNARLDAKMENPELREFAPGFLNAIKRKRIDLLVAALTIWRWGRQQAESNLEHGKALGSFEVWAKWVRDPLLTLGCPDPIERLKEIKANDPSRQRAADLFTTWWECHQGSPVKVSELDQRVIDVIDPGEKRSLNWRAARVAEFVGTRQSGFVLEIFGLPGAGKRGTEYHLQMTDEHPEYDEKNPFDAAQSPASPASPAPGEEKALKSGGSGRGHLAGGFDHSQTIRTTRRPPADHPQTTRRLRRRETASKNNRLQTQMRVVRVVRVVWPIRPTGASQAGWRLAIPMTLYS